MTKVMLFSQIRALFFCCTTFFVFSAGISAQQKQEISGFVLDDGTHEPVIGAGIFLTDEKTGTVTDVNGRFTIPVTSFPVSLSASYIGYKTIALELYEYTEPVTVYLREDLNFLNEVVVIGYGTQKRKELTGAVATIPAQTLQQATTSFDQSLGGTVAGLNVTQTSGQPGATSSIRIRGGNSITGGNEPLYVIDGFILYNDNSSTRTDAGEISGGLNPLASIYAGDIESIEVLKDVSATAIYGSRGANGVVVITTRKGKKGRTHINYQSTAGWQQIRKKADLLNAEEWTALYTDIQASEGKPAYSGPVAHCDWQEEALRKALTQNHQLSLSGGDGKTRILVSGNYTGQEGIIRNTGFERYAARVNLDHDLFSNLNVAVNFAVSNSAQRSLSNLNNHYSNGSISDPFNYALRMPPVVPVYNTDGSYNYANPYSEGDFHLGDFAVNPVSDLLDTDAQTKNTNTIGNIVTAYTIIPSLVAKINAGANLSNTVQNYYAPSTSAVGLLLNGYGSVGSKRFNSWQTEFTLNYNKQINAAHYVDILAGYTTQKTDVEFITGSSNNYANESLAYHNLSGGSGLITPVSGGSESVLNSFLGRVNYSLHGRYNLTATLRADGSSRFAENRRWGYFPSIGLSWNINDEAFYRKDGFASALKLRLSAGTAGNQEIGDYKYEATYGTRNYSFGGQLVTAYLRNNRENSDLKWETTAQYNIGLDAVLWKEHLNLTVDAYYKNTSDLLVDIPLESTSGFESMLKNVGNISNKGIEIGLNANLVRRKDLNWTASVNFAKNINEITDLGGQKQFFPLFSNTNGLTTLRDVDPLIVRTGESLGSFYGYIFDGVIQTGEDISNIPVPGWFDQSLQPGDPKFVNRNGDNLITGEDKAVLGSAQPDFTYGFSSTLNYKGLDFFFIFQGSQGNELYNAFRHTLEATSIYYNAAGTLRDRWTPSNPSTTVPRAINTPFLTVDSRYIEDASFLRLKNITLGYTIPVKTGKTSSLGIRLFASAQNLLTFTKYSGFDPEASYYGGDETSGLYQGIDLGAYPSSRTFIFGVNLSY
jgi:TonB-linked SusC/RagA family outer membrane protein